MNRIETVNRLSEADRIVNAQAVYREFSADRSKRNFLVFGKNLLFAVIVCLLGWVEVYLILGGSK